MLYGRVVAAVAVLSLAGCGGTSTAGPTADPAASGSASAVPTKEANPLTEAQLQAAALSAGELSGYQFDTHPNMHDDASVAKPAGCQPLEDVRISVFNPKPKALASFLAWKTSPPAQGLTVDVELIAYDPGDAKQFLAKLRAAVAACGSGYAGGVLKFPAVTAQTAPAIGDEAVSYMVAGRTDTSWYAVVRSDTTVVVFGAGGPRPEFDRVPEDLVRAQMAKVEKVRG
jgi:hypothetical protein